MRAFHVKHRFLALLFGLCIGSASAAPVRTLNSLPSQTPRKATGTRTVPFKISFPPPGKEFKPGDTITIKGTHKLPTDAHVWIFLRDIYQGYYLQNPPVELLANGNWEATNIRPGREIRYILAIGVSREGNEIVKGWVKAGRFGKIEEEEIKGLSGSKELARVKIKTPGSE